MDLPGCLRLVPDRQCLATSMQRTVPGAAAHPKHSMSGVVGAQGGAPEVYMKDRCSNGQRRVGSTAPAGGV